MNESTKTERHADAAKGELRIANRRSRRGLTVAFAALVIAVFGTGVVAPPATAAEVREPTYELTVNGETISFAEGETVTVGMESVGSAHSSTGASLRDVYSGNAGVLTVTGSGGAFRYSIAMSIPVTTFVGVFTVSDLTNGQSGGRTPVFAFAGSVPTSNLRGHQYSGVLEGTAFFLGAAVAKTMPNNTRFTN